MHIASGFAILIAEAMEPPRRGFDHSNVWRARQDSNLQPKPYKGPALSIELRTPTKNAGKRQLPGVSILSSEYAVHNLKRVITLRGELLLVVSFPHVH